MGQTTTTIIFILIIFGMLGLTVFLQTWRMSRSPLGKVLGIFKDVKFNEKLNENFNAGGNAGRFRTAAWNKHKKSVGFLPEEMLLDMDKLFGEIGEINARVDEAAKLGSRGYAGNYDTGKMRTNLVDMREKLREWLQSNMYNRDYHPKKLGFFRWR